MRSKLLYSHLYIVLNLTPIEVVVLFVMTFDCIILFQITTIICASLAKVIHFCLAQYCLIIIIRTLKRKFKFCIFMIDTRV